MTRLIEKEIYTSNNKLKSAIISILESAKTKIDSTNVNELTAGEAIEEAIAEVDDNAPLNLRNMAHKMFLSSYQIGQIKVRTKEEREAHYDAEYNEAKIVEMFDIAIEYLKREDFANLMKDMQTVDSVFKKMNVPIIEIDGIT